jgi:hypothetical protein
VTSCRPCPTTLTRVSQRDTFSRQATAVSGPSRFRPVMFSSYSLLTRAAKCPRKHAKTTEVVRAIKEPKKVVALTGPWPHLPTLSACRIRGPAQRQQSVFFIKYRNLMSALIHAASGRHGTEPRNHGIFVALGCPKSMNGRSMRSLLARQTAL